MASVVFDHVSKAFGSTPVLDGLDFAVEDGEFFVVLGPSRSGKSTLLRLAAGLDTVDDGAIRFGDRDVTSMRPSERDVGMFFQNYALYPNKTGYQNIAASLVARGEPKRRVRERVDEVAALLNVAHLLDRKPATYSGGEQQRVAIGRTIARRAQVYLFDEPLSNLDALVRLRLRTEFKRIQRDLGITTLYVTPDQNEALALADRVMVLREGRIAQIGEPREMYARPHDAFVARFLGSPPMNVMAGVIDRDGDGLAFRHPGGGRIAIEAGGRDRPWPLGRDVLFGVRPERVTLPDGGAGQASVATTESLGRRKLARLQFGGDECQVVVDARSPVLEGERVRPSCAGQDVHLFAVETGARLAL